MKCSAVQSDVVLNIVGEVSARKCSSCLKLSAIFFPCCPCIFLKSCGMKDLENGFRCFSCVCLLTDNKKPVYDTTSLRTRSGGRRGDAKCQKKAPSFVKFQF